MKKYLRNTIIVFFIVAIAVFTYSYGWKFMGFKGCINPDIVIVNNVEVNSDQLTILGTSTSSSLNYVGYTYEITNDSLFVGLRYSNLSLFRRNSDFNIVIPIESSSFNKIILKGKNSTRELWSQ